MRLTEVVVQVVEEPRKAVGMRRSWKRMEELTVKLRKGMDENRIPPETQDACSCRAATVKTNRP